MPKSRSHLELGADGEARAAAHLRVRGYRIAARNVRAGGVEMDLIARRGRVIAFVEVKTRRSQTFGAPEEAVDARKRARLVRGAAAWLREHPANAARIRFDVIVCEKGPRNGWQVRHLEAAFDASGD